MYHLPSGTLFPFFGSRFPYKLTNQKRSALILIWLLGYQDQVPGCRFVNCSVYEGVRCKIFGAAKVNGSPRAGFFGPQLQGYRAGRVTVSSVAGGQVVNLGFIGGGSGEAHAQLLSAIQGTSSLTLNPKP